MKYYAFLLLSLSACGQIPDSLSRQRDRADVAADSVMPLLRTELGRKGAAAGDSVYIRIFKQEKILELWVHKTGGNWILFREMEVCAASGKPGPKRVQGDEQVPEGVYHIEHYNPESSFHLSLGINYPNAADRFFSDKAHPGGDIYIHGHCASIGCVAITDEPIEIVYLLARAAHQAGQEKVSVHIFPCRMDAPTLGPLMMVYPQHRSLWTELKRVHDFFEKHQQLPMVGVDERGSYQIGR